MITVLYVDDEPSLLEIATLFLEKTGEFSVDTALSASEGLEKLHQAQYDVIISDYQMPGMDGIEFLRALRAEGNKTPFIIFTGKGREEVVIQALNGGADFYLQKGGDPTAQFAELQSKIRQATSLRRAEERIVYLNRVNSLLSQVNKSIVRIRNRDELFKAICTVAIEHGKFRMAWIGIIDPETRMLLPVASAGFGAAEYLRIIKISVEDIPEGKGPSGRAVREGTSIVSNDILQDPLMQPWQEPAGRSGYRSSGAFPIRCRGDVIGALTLYAAEPDFFSRDEAELLKEVAADISFSLDNLELDRERLTAVEALSQSEEKYRTLVETSFDGIVIHQDGSVVYANATAVRLLGAGSGDAILGKPILSFVHPEYRNVANRRIASATRETQPILREKFLRTDGTVIDVDVVAIPFFWKNMPAVHVVFRDITENKKAEDALKKSEEKYRQLAAIVESSDDAIIGKTLEGIITSWNRGAEKIYGYTSREIVGKSIATLIPAGKKNELPGILEKIRAGGHVDHYETTRVRNDARQIQISLTISPIRNAEGTIISASTIARDITDRKLADERLKQAEQKYRNLFENALEGIYQITPKGKLLTANPAMARILGYDSVEDLITTVTDTARQLWAHQEQRKDYIRQLREHDVVEDFECEFFRKDKSPIWVALTTHTVRGTDKKIMISEGILADITRRKKAERELIDRESEYRTILHTTMDGFCIISPDGKFLDVNDAFCRLTGYSRDELFVRSLSDIEAKETADVISEHSREIIRKGEDRFETRYRRKDGSLIDVEVSVVATDRHGGQFVTFHHDITERIRAHEALISARNELEQKVFERTRELKATNESLQAEIVLRNKAENDIVTSLKEKEMLLKEIHHRVKNNMQVISSLLFMQARAQKDETIKGILQESQDRIKSIALVHEKLYQSTDLDRIDYTDYLRKITEHLFESYKIDPTIVKLHLNAEKAVLHIDKAVPCSLIINELISNSLKHAFPGGRKGVITIDFRKGVDNYILTYSDDGIGIPEGITFDRTDSMGMQLIKGLTKQINGSIALDRTVGTKYTITFPA